jgi:hypothetical protein
MSNVNIIFVLTSESQLRWLLAPTEEMKGKKRNEKKRKKGSVNGPSNLITSK